MHMRRSAASFAALTLAFVATTLHPACNCDEVLGSQAAEAELAFGDDRTPPLDRLLVSAGAVIIGQSLDIKLDLDNVGNLPLVITSVALVRDQEFCPAPSGEFTIPAAAPKSLAIGESTSIVVKFTPQVGAPACAVVAIDTNDETNPRLTAVITAQGDASALCTDKTLVDFGDVIVGDSKDDVVTLRSCGTRAVTVTGFGENDQFPPFGVTESGATGVVLEPEQTIDVPVSFSPTVAGRHSIELGNQGLLDVQTDIPGAIFQLALIGNAKNPPACIVDVVPAVLQFGYVQPSNVATQQIIVRNLGELACNVTNMALRDGVDEFAIDFAGATTPLTMEPLSTLTFTVTFTAPAVEGAVENAFLLDSNDPVHPSFVIPMQGAVPSDEGCFVNATPSAVDFGAVPIGTLRAREVTITNVGQDPCFVNDTQIAASSDPGFIDASSDFGVIFPGASRTLTVAFRPITASSSADGIFEVTVSDSLFSGTDSLLTIPLSAFTGDPGLCVTPRHLDFGEPGGELDLDFTVSACGAATITVSDLQFTVPDSELTMVSAPALPRTLSPGQAFDVTIRYAPVDEGADTAEITVVSNDIVSPEIPVRLTGGNTIVPPEAGRFLYFWSIPNSLAGQAQGGDIMKMPLQGADAPQPFWGPRNGKGCAGCHSISPDGRYVAVVEVGSMRFVEAETNLELFLGDTELLNPTSFSWRPNVNTDPPYQFVYSNNLDIIKATLFDGEIGTVQGANDANLIETMPTWGRDGTIAFVRGASTATTADGSFGLAGATDILLIDEDGGVAHGVNGASENGFANYYPSFSPNGLWIAFTQSQAAQSTVAATDAKIFLAPSDNTGPLVTLAAFNTPDGPSSYTTWSVDGSFLSFSSIRPGGQGDWDIYFGRVDPFSGAASELQPFSEINTADFEHAAQWSP